MTVFCVFCVQIVDSKRRLVAIWDKESSANDAARNANRDSYHTMYVVESWTVDSYD